MQEIARSKSHSNLRSIKAKEDDKVEIFMIHIIMTRETIKVGIDQIVKTGEFSLTDKVEVGQGINKTIEEETLGATQGHIKILEDRIVEENTEVIIGMKITVERQVEAGPEKDHF